MGKWLLAVGLVVGFATMAHAGMIITLDPQLSGPPNPGDLIPVHVLLSSESGTIELVRDFQFDVQDNWPGGQFANEIFVDPNHLDRWQWDPPMAGPGWFIDDPLPIPRANWIKQAPDPPGELINVLAEPNRTRVAVITVEFLAPGYLDVTNRDDPERNIIDEGASFRSGFNGPGGDVRHFSVYWADDPVKYEPVLGGRVFIPEPATLALLLVGVAAVLRRRRFA